MEKKLREELLHAYILWKNNLNYYQRVIFSIAAEVYRKNKWENINHYSDITELALKNIQRVNPNATKKSMGGWITHLNKSGITQSIVGGATEYTIDEKGNFKTRNKRDNGFEITEKGVVFIEKHYDLIANFIKNKDIELYGYLNK